MSEKENREFDRVVREMMLDMEKDVPSGVWGRIASGTAAKPPIPMIRYAGIGFAVAAALAAAFLLTGTSDRGLNSIIGDTATASVQMAENGSGNMPVEEAAVEPVRSTAGQEIPTPGRTIVTDGAAASDYTVVADDTVTSDGTVATEEPAQIRGRTFSAPERRKIEPEPFDDPFARMALEDARAEKRHINLDIHGLISGSEGQASPVARMTSGSSTVEQERLDESSVSSFGVPFTLGAGIRIGIAPRLSIDTGLDYSLLTRTFSGTWYAGGGAAGLDGDVLHTMHYIGIPLKLSYNFIESGALSVYVSGGGKAEWCISNNYAFRAGDFSRTMQSAVDRPQLSVGLNLGAEYKITDNFSLYLDPGVKYFFYSRQPKSIRTEKPFMFDLSLGIRFRVR